MGKGKPTFSSFCFTVPRLEAQSGRGEITQGCLLLKGRDEEEREEKEMSSKEAGAEVAHRGRELGGKTPIDNLF
jgi:hypothetical protein